MFEQRVWLLGCVLLGCLVLSYGSLATRADDTDGGAAKAKANPNDAGNDAGKEKKPAFRAGAIRYQVTDVERAVAFYTQHLGFTRGTQPGSAFATVSHGNLTLWLSGPKSSGSRPMPDGRRQTPGGWNRLVLEVDDLGSVVGAMKQAGLRFRNEIEIGPGGKQIQLQDPDGNPVELFEPAS